MQLSDKLTDRIGAGNGAAEGKGMKLRDGCRHLAVLLVALVTVASSWPARAQDAAQDQIKQVLQAQESDWNRGDVEAFMHGYKDSPDTTFIGKSVEHGYRAILQRYKAAYTSQAIMGKLDFSGLDVRMLGSRYAVATGKFHLARSAAGGGDTSGLFSLVFEKTPEGWRIIVDHTG